MAVSVDEDELKEAMSYLSLSKVSYMYLDLPLFVYINNSDALLFE